jgi:hypothetical protein
MACGAHGPRLHHIFRRPQSRGDVEIAMHYQRTVSTTVGFKFRAYSHRWLTERGIPSMLPDELKPRAERMYPMIVSGVGIAVKAKNPLFQPIADEVRKAMEIAVREADADQRLTDVPFVRQRMREARERTYKELTGVKL